MLAELIDSNDRDSAAADLVRRYRAEKRAVPGFGHPIHTGTDPRVEKLLSYVARDSQALQAAESLEGALSEALGKPLVMNVSTALAILMFEIGIPVSAMRGVILISRCAGLVGHLLEEMNTPVGNDLWRSAEGSVTYQPN